MPEVEGLALYEAAWAAADEEGSSRVMIEIGAWCGKSTIYLGAAAAAVGPGTPAAASSVLFSIDHHRGSEEQQPGWDHHDPALVDVRSGRIDTLPSWRRTIEAAGLESCVIGVVGDSRRVAAAWHTPICFCFIDGGHGEDAAWGDYNEWSPHVQPGGLLAIHDVFPEPAEGGRPPFEIYSAALSSGNWVETAGEGSLRILRRI